MADPELSTQVAAAAAKARAQLETAPPKPPPAPKPTTNGAGQGSTPASPKPPAAPKPKPEPPAPPPAAAAEAEGDELELEGDELEGEAPLTPEADPAPDGPRTLTAADAQAAADAIAAGDFDALAKALGVDAAALKIPARRAKFVREQSEAATTRLREAQDAERRTKAQIDALRSEAGPVLEGLTELRRSGAKLPALQALAAQAGLSVQAYLQAAAREHKGEAPAHRERDPEVAELRAKLEAREKAEAERSEREAAAAREQRLVAGIEARLGRHSVSKLEGYQGMVLRELREQFPGKRITARELKIAADSIVGRARKTASALGLTPRAPERRSVPSRAITPGAPMDDSTRLQWAMAQARERLRQ